jgi:hypothetical protein
MHKNYDIRRANSYRSYTIADLCRLHSDEGLHQQTPRGWIKHHGLKAWKVGNEYYVYGAVWKKYLFERNNKKKRRLEFRQMKCEKCKAIVEPLNSTIHLLQISISGGLQAKVTCSHCGHNQKRFYKKSEHQRLYDNFLVLQDETGILCDSSNSPNKTHFITGVKTPVSEPEENTTTLPCNTHLMKTQTNLLDLL